MNMKMPIKSIDDELPIPGIPGVAALVVAVAGALLIVAGVGGGWIGDAGAAAIAIGMGITSIGIAGMRSRRRRTPRSSPRSISTFS